MKHIRTLLVVTALIPFGAGAQEQPAPGTQLAANPITRSFLDFGFYGGWLLVAFDSIPANQYGFRPTPAQQTIGHVAQHLEDANYTLCERFGTRARTVTARDSLPETVKAAWPKDTLVVRLRRSLEFCRDALLTVTDARLAEQLPATDRMRAAPRSRFVILFFTDLVDHYAQIANYMRILGMTPPSALP